jgi:iron complex outermembrane recepter protein
MKTRMFLNAAFIAISGMSFSQKILTGKVVDEGGSPVYGAKVVCESNGQRTVSNADGVFRLNFKEEQQTSIQVEATGFNKHQQIIEKSDFAREVRVVLYPNAKNLEEVQVTATRQIQSATSALLVNAKKDLERKDFGQDIPMLLEFTPSVVTTSDAGAGVGYTGIRIRGVDASRINVTINGIPVNDPESHDVYWVNMPDLVGSIENIQVQRGVGSSTNGAAAFGASVNIKTKDIEEKPYATLDNSYGSFNTMKNSLRVGTGLMNNKFAFDARLSSITSDGYIDRATSDLKSYYLSGAWVGKKSLLKAVVFNGKERTYQSWYGTPESRVRGEVDEMNAYADRNGLSEEERENLLSSGRTYNYYTYKNQVDNYAQDNYQLHFTHSFKKNLVLNVAAHHTYGRGYYEEYRRNQRLSNYGIAPVVIGDTTITRTDLIRRRWLDNRFWGGVYSLNYRFSNWNFVFGGAANTYSGQHFGEVIWARFASNSEIEQRYYDNDARKWESSNYLKTTYRKGKFQVVGDLQYRYVNYRFLGIDEVSGEIKDVEQNIDFHFFNPKIAATYSLGYNQEIFVSYGIGNREPVRRDFRESTPANRPKAETMRDLELGYQYNSSKFHVMANLYWMDYTNQLILTGQINDVGGYTRTNVKDSYRAGLEFVGAYKVLKFLRLNAGFTLSQNKIKVFNEYVDEYLDDEPYYTQRVIEHKNADLAFSPNIVANGGFTVMPIKNLTIDWMTKYVGRQFLDNTSNVNRSINPFTFSNLVFSYNLKNVFFKEMTFGFQINNLFNAMYSNNGYTFSYIYGGETTTENFYYPQAGRHFMGRILIGL